MQQSAPSPEYRRARTLTAVLGGLVFVAVIVLAWGSFSGCSSVFAADACPTGANIQTDGAITQNFTSAFGFTFAGTPTAARTHTLQDVTGTLYQTGGTDVALLDGGTNKSITASAGTVVYSDADSFELTTVGTANKCLLSNGASAPNWSTGNCYQQNGTDVAMDDGGTGASLTPSNGAVVFSNASTLALTAVGSSGNCLTSVGAGTPVWASCSTAGGGTDVQTFTATGTWTKPAGALFVQVEMFGAGGSGGNGVASGSANGATAGGGGAHCVRIFNASLLAATETVNVPAGATPGSGASASGNLGGTAAFGSWVSCYGGGRGAGGAAGGGGGGTGATGGAAGGAPTVLSGTNSIGGGGASPGASTAAGGNAEWGGGGSAGLPSASAGANPGVAGGSSIYGGAGGGSSGGCASAASANGGAGGANSSYTAGGGGAGGVGNGGAGAVGASSTNGGAGGGGGASGVSGTTGGVGGNGGVPGGGGGGGGSACNSGTQGAGGSGGRAEVRVTTWG